jgi:carbamoyl-phosphate synthase large subunit
MGEKVNNIDKSSFDLDYVGVKASQFSFTRLKGSDPITGVEMASTGEVGCLGDDFSEAFLKSCFATGHKKTIKSVFLSTGTAKQKAEVLEELRLLYKSGVKFYATQGTATYLKENNIEATVLYRPYDTVEPNINTYLNERKMDLVINIPRTTEKDELDSDYIIRRKAVDMNIPLITNTQFAKRFIKALQKYDPDMLEVKSWDEYN